MFNDFMALFFIFDPIYQVLHKKAACISTLLWEGAELKWIPKHTATVNAFLNEVRSHEGL